MSEATPEELFEHRARIEQMLADSDKLRSEDYKLRMESNKFRYEAEKLHAEERKLNRDAFFLPWIAALGGIAGFIAAMLTAAKSLGWLH